MFDVQGKYTNATIFNDNVEAEAIAQIMELCNQDYMQDAKVRIMPDVHAGAGCTIGTTFPITDRICVNLVGVDIGCGMLTVKMGKNAPDLKQLDEACHLVPSGKDVHAGRIVHFEELQSLNCYRELKDTKRIERSIGTLGGGK